MLELIFAGVALAGFLVLLDRKDKRAVEAVQVTRLEHERALLVLVDRMRDSEVAHRGEVQTLLQRIQAPEVAVVQHQQESAVDENPYPLTDEESAEAQDERARMIAALEALENEGVLT